MKTENLPENIVRLSDIRIRKSVALSPFGPVRAGLTTSRITPTQQLSELLSDLERKVDDLTSRSSTVLNTLTIDIAVLRVVLRLGSTSTCGTDTIKQ